MTHAGWIPPPRPAWVEHLNAMGRALGDSAELVSLDPDEMLAASQRSTGLSNFGSDSWSPNYRVLVDAVAREAELHVAGRLLTRSEIMRSLRNRLFVEAYLERHPDALERRVEAPIVICGYGRSGTSITQELLALDPNHRAPLAWELFNLSPISETCGERRADRVAFAEGEQLFYEDVVPEYRTMHENGAELPVECLMFQMHEFLSAQFFGTLDVPSYLMHAMTADRTNAYRYEYRMLQVMQHQAPGRRWVLKGPTHQERLEVLFDVFPDARVVHLHRDPRKMIPSTFSLMGALRWMRSDRVDLSALAFMPMSMQSTLERGIIQRQQRTIPAEQVYDLRYADLTRDPVAAIADCYAHHGLAYDQAIGSAVRAHLAAKPRGKHGAHEYTLEEFGLDTQALGTMFAHYQDHYGIPEEVGS